MNTNDMPKEMSSVDDVVAEFQMHFDKKNIWKDENGETAFIPIGNLEYWIRQLVVNRDAHWESLLEIQQKKWEEEIEKAVREEREKCQISNFKCSNHGVITPRPICPKCFPDTTSKSSEME